MFNSTNQTSLTHLGTSSCQPPHLNHHKSVENPTFIETQIPAYNTDNPTTGPRHPHHTPETSLQPSTSCNTSTSNERPIHSHSSAVSLSVLDDYPDLDAMDESGPEIIADGLMLDDNDNGSDMLYMGGGISLDNGNGNVGVNMGLKPCNNYFTSFREN